MTACLRCGHDDAVPIVARWTMTLPLEPPSQNQVHNKTRFSKEARLYRQFRDEYALLFLSEMRRQGIAAATGRRIVTITRLIGKGHRLYDAANMVGGCKPAIDSMVNVGLLKDDTERWFQGWYRQEKDEHGKGGVVILIEEVQL